MLKNNTKILSYYALVVVVFLCFVFCFSFRIWHCLKIPSWIPPCPSRPCQTTIVDTRVIVGVEKVADGGVVVVAHLGYLELRIDGNLEYVRATWQLCDVHPLAVEIVQINVGAVDGDACKKMTRLSQRNLAAVPRNATLIPEVGAVVFLGHAGQTAAVLQAEGSLVALGDLATLQIKDIEGGKDLHAVVVPARG